MLVSYNWLKKYVDLDISAEQLAERLTFAGLELDEIIYQGGGFTNVAVAQVLTCDPVTGSDHLHLLSVDIGGTEPLTVICGAPNVAAGQIVACAKVGAELPGGFQITARKTFGVLSQGMICSQKELGLSEDHSGIWVLDDYFAGQAAPLGQELAEALALKDTVLLIELTPNRSDCLGMLNIAREAAALTGKTVRLPDLCYAELGGPAADAIGISVEDPRLCPRYVGRVVRQVKIGPSPLWMQRCLLAAGMRPINNVVDISNFVMLEMNQPLHTFDYDKLRGRRIIVRAARTGEQMQTLDGKVREFSGEEILICDGDGPVCVAGVMGGMDTEVTEQTVNILIESACFDPPHIRRTARKLGIPSEASQRFEKGVDVAACDVACRRAAQLLVQYCGGVADQGCVDARAPYAAGGFPEKKITLRPQRVNHILGTDFSPEEIAAVMTALNFPYEDCRGQLLVNIPSYRLDIEAEVDLIEEVARIKGYDRIPATIPMNAGSGGRNGRQQLLLWLKNLCAGLGLSETVNYSFISPKESDRLGLAAEHPWRQGLMISNPLSEEQSVMRQSLLPGLLHTTARNQSRRNMELRLFELGSIFIPAAERSNEQQPTEVLTLGLLLAGRPTPHWQEQPQDYDFFALKGLVEALAESLGLPQLTFSRAAADYLHPGKSAEICLNGERLGFLGELHPETTAAYELIDRVQVAELAVEPLLQAALAQGNHRHELPRYPASTRDIAVIGPAPVAAAAIEAAICASGGPYLETVRLFDLYDRPPIQPGYRSLAYALSFRAPERTLTDQEVDQAFAAIVAALAEQYGYQLR